MTRNIDQIKLAAFGKHIQITFFKPDGTVVDSCQSVIPLDQGRSIYEQFAFLQSLEEVFKMMEAGESHDFPAVEWDEGGKGLFHLNFEGINEAGELLIQWTLINNTGQYEQLAQLQQGRNDKAIAEEFAQIQKEVADAQRKLVEFQNEELKRIQDFKSTFFAKVSHEMRTPLNSIAGLVALIEEEPEKLEEYLGSLKSTARHLTTIINDILDLSKIEAGELSLESIDFSLNEELSAVLEGFRFAAREKGLALRSELPDKGLWVKGDPVRLAQVIYNLMGNSLKFTEKGHITLELRILEDDPELQLNFKVEDTGLGMTPDQLENILQPYTQAGDHVARLYGGTGLGLNIVNKLVEMMGGQLDIESEPGFGTAISFALSFAKANAPEVEEASGSWPDLSNKDILLAEDDPLNAKVMLAILEKMGATHVSKAKDGRLLLNRLEQKRFDLVITDINLPEHTGIEVFSQLRKNGRTEPFLFVSGDGIERYPEVQPFDNWDFVIKPITLPAVAERIEQLLPQRFPTEINLSSLHNMVAGDESFFQELLRTILETLPQELAKLQGAMEAMDTLTAKKVLHKIRPSIDYLGIPELSDERRWLHDQAEAEQQETDFQSRAADFDSWAKQVLIKLEEKVG